MIDLTKVSACLITKDPVYPPSVLSSVMKYSFGEIMLLTGCDSPHRKHEIIEKAKYPNIYYQDDDCYAPIEQLAQLSDPSMINCAMKEFHINKYRNSKIALLGWGSFFPKACTKVLEKYRKAYGEDFLYKRETERIMTWFNYPQNRFELPITDLPSAWANDRLSNQPGHYDYIPMIEERCEQIAGEHINYVR